MRRFALLLLTLFVGACGSSGKDGDSKPGFFDRMFSGNSGPSVTCPQVGKVGDVAKVTRFAPGGHDLTDVAFEAAVGKLGGDCQAAVAVNLTVEFIAGRGPADKTRKAPFSYFVAIVDKDDKVLAREQFDTGVQFPGNQTRNAIVEELEENIPVKDPLLGNQYRIFVGFVLTPEEIAYNRAHP